MYICVYTYDIYIYIQYTGCEFEIDVTYPPLLVFGSERILNSYWFLSEMDMAPIVVMKTCRKTRSHRSTDF